MLELKEKKKVVFIVLFLVCCLTLAPVVQVKSIQKRAHIHSSEKHSEQLQQKSRRLVYGIWLSNFSIHLYGPFIGLVTFGLDEGAGVCTPQSLAVSVALAEWLMIVCCCVNSIVFGALNTNFRQQFRPVLARKTPQAQDQEIHVSFSVASLRISTLRWGEKFSASFQERATAQPEDQSIVVEKCVVLARPKLPPKAQKKSEEGEENHPSALLPSSHLSRSHARLCSQEPSLPRTDLAASSVDSLFRWIEPNWSSAAHLPQTSLTEFTSGARHLPFRGRSCVLDSDFLYGESPVLCRASTSSPATSDESTSNEDSIAPGDNWLRPRSTMSLPELLYRRRDPLDQFRQEKGSLMLSKLATIDLSDHLSLSDTTNSPLGESSTTSSCDTETASLFGAVVLGAREIYTVPGSSSEAEGGGQPSVTGQPAPKVASAPPAAGALSTGRRRKRPKMTSVLKAMFLTVATGSTSGQRSSGSPQNRSAADTGLWCSGSEETRAPTHAPPKQVVPFSVPAGRTLPVPPQTQQASSSSTSPRTRRQ